MQRGLRKSVSAGDQKGHLSLVGTIREVEFQGVAVQTGLERWRRACEGGAPRRELSGAENSTRGTTLGREKEVKQSNGLFPSVRFRGRKC